MVINQQTHSLLFFCFCELFSQKEIKEKDQMSWDSMFLLALFMYILTNPVSLLYTLQATGVLWKTSLQRSSTVHLYQSPTTLPGSRPSSVTPPWLKPWASSYLSPSHDLNCRASRASTGNNFTPGHQVFNNITVYKMHVNWIMHMCYIKWAYARWGLWDDVKRGNMKN